MAGASSELFPSEGKKAESAVVKKLKQPKKKKEKKNEKNKDKDGQKDASVGEEEDEEDEEEEEEGGVGSLMIVKTAGEAWERLQERLKESPIIQVRRFSFLLAAMNPELLLLSASVVVSSTG